MADPFEVLGLPSDATAEAVADARRTLAVRHHPDRGGDPVRMREINAAADAALRIVADREAGPSAGSAATGRSPSPDAHRTDRPVRREASGVARDVPSFTVEALPVVTFEALVVVASWMGEVLDDDPPYRLDAYLGDPFDCWCRLDVVPDAGSSTVSLAVAGLDGAPTPDVLAVRDAWIANLNALDWDAP